MVQEFQVLKCYSCETFQVHQVKKSKKWNCKLCGEKQSIIKVFGCGSGVDCRRHVQKLNSRRGEMLEEQNQKAWSQWEEEEAQDEELGDGARGYDGQNATSTVAEAQGSRWSKYLQKPGDGDTPEEEEEKEEEEEEVRLVRNRHPGDRNVRKRKRGRRNGNEGNTYQSGEEENSATSPGGWRSAGRSSKPLAHQNRYSSSFTTEKSSKALAAFRPVPAYTNLPPATATSPSKPAPSTSTLHKPPLNAASVPNRLNTATSQSVSSGNTTVSKTSRWAQFLTTPSPEEEEEEEDDENHWGFSATRNSEYQVQDYTKAPSGQPGCDASSVATLGDGGFLGMSVGNTFNRLKSTFALCGFGEANGSKAGPAPMASCESEEPVCHQPPPTKLPCPSLSVASLFYTDEDFDDTF